MPKVIQLPTKPDRDRKQYVCGTCGSTTMRLFSDGSVECAACDNTGMLKMDPEIIEGNMDPRMMRQAIDFDDKELALRRMEKRIRDPATRLVLTLRDDGLTSRWYDVDTPAQYEWAANLLDHAAKEIRDEGNRVAVQGDQEGQG